MAQISIVQKSQLEGPMRLDAEYYQPKYLQLNKSLMAWKGGNVKKLSAIGTVEYGFMPMEDYASQDEGEPLIRVTNILGNLLVNMDDVKFIRNGLASSRKRVKHGDILVVQCGDTTGKVAFISSELDNFVFPSFCLRVRTQELVPEYLAVFLNSRLGQSQIMRGITYATVRPNTTKPNIQNILVVIPPEEIQYQVAMAVSSAFAETKRSKVFYLQAEQLLLDELGFKELDLSHQLYYTAPFKKTREANRLDAEHFQPKYDRVVEFIKKREHTTLAGLGKVLRGKNPSKYTEEGIPVIRAIDLRNILDTTVFLRCPPEKGLFYLRRGDILISSIGWGSIGKVATFTHSEHMVTVSEVSVIRQNEIEPLALQIFLQSPLGQLQLERKITGSTGQLHLYPRDIGTMVIPCLAPSLQQQIADLVTQSWEARQKARQLLEEAKSKVESLIEGEAA